MAKRAPMTGGCLCGRVRYVIHGEPFHSTLCYCVSCRRAAGAPVVAWLTVRLVEFVVVTGAPQVFVSSPGVTRGFCGTCGTPLTYARAALPGEIDVTTASLDDPEHVPPEDETHVAERLAWTTRLGRLPAFPGARDG